MHTNQYAQFTNDQTRMRADVFYMSPLKSSMPPSPWKVILTDLDSGSVASVHWLPSLKVAKTFAHDLVFPSSRLISSPTFLPEFN